jgi:hypothetical protein
VIPAAVEETIQEASGDMPSSLVDALRTVARIHPEWVAMALQAPSLARASMIATLLQEAATHSSLAVEATTLREVAAAISTTMAMPHDNGRGCNKNHMQHLTLLWWSC